MKRRRVLRTMEPVIDSLYLTTSRYKMKRDCIMGAHNVITSYDVRTSPAIARSYMHNKKGKYYRYIKRKLDDVSNDVDNIRKRRAALIKMFPKREPTESDIVGNDPPLVAMVKMHKQKVFVDDTYMLRDYGPTVPIYRGGSRRHHLCLVAFGVSWDIYIGVVEIDTLSYGKLDFFRARKLKRAKPKVVRLRRFDDGKR